MAKAKDQDSTATVTRIKADGKNAKVTKKGKPAKEVKRPKTKKESDNDAIEKRGTIFTYFKGAWYELRQVHWPTRGATWGLTGAVLAFSAFFVVSILLLDALFKWIFELILK